MARSEKTQPFRVKLWDGTLHRVAVHNHVDAVCDLPSTLDEDLDRHRAFRPFGTSCHWDLRFTGTRVCACPMCSARAERREVRRRDRHDSAARLRGIAKEARQDWRDLDD